MLKKFLPTLFCTIITGLFILLYFQNIRNEANYFGELKQPIFLKTHGMQEMDYHYKKGKLSCLFHVFTNKKWATTSKNSQGWIIPKAFPGSLDSLTFEIKTALYHDGKLLEEKMITPKSLQYYSDDSLSATIFEYRLEDFNLKSNEPYDFKLVADVAQIETSPWYKKSDLILSRRASGDKSGLLFFYVWFFSKVGMFIFGILAFILLVNGFRLQTVLKKI